MARSKVERWWYAQRAALHTTGEKECFSTSETHSNVLSRHHGQDTCLGGVFQGRSPKPIQREAFHIAGEKKGVCAGRGFRLSAPRGAKKPA